MRIGDWKILADEELTRFELFHLGRDPREEKELSTAEPAKFAEMTRELRRLNAEIEAEGPPWWRTYNHGGAAGKRKSSSPRRRRSRRHARADS